jgi:dTMP kinase
MNKKGRLITIEGIEGVGKSTNVSFTADCIRQAGMTVVVTREPGGTPLAEAIRKLLLDSEPGSVPDTCELLLMFAARASHLSDLIRPALGRGDWVVCDRFTDASFAYQGSGRGMDYEAIANLEGLVQQGLTPDLTLLLDAPMEVADARREQRAVTDRFESEHTAFFRRVQAGYRAIAEREPDRIKVINAARSLADVQASIHDVLDSYIKENS